MKKLSYILLFFLLVQGLNCCAPVPVIKNPELSKKYPLHVAIDASCSHNCKYYDKVNGCWQYGKQYIPRSITVNLNKIAIQVFQKGLQNIFDEVSIVYDSSDLYKKSFDIIFDIRIDSISAINKVKKCGAGRVESEIYFNLTAEDINGNFIDNFYEYGKYEGIGGISFGDFIRFFIYFTPLTLLTEGFSIQDNYYNSVYASATKAYNEIANRLISSNKFATFAQNIIEKKTTPASLHLDIKYSDINSYLPNSTIDAGERSEINVNVTNKGQGTAFDTKLLVICKNKNIEFPTNISVGEIPPNETKTVTIPVAANLSIESSQLNFQINATEKRGYDSKTYMLNVAAKKLKQPDLKIIKYTINDSNTGKADGNGNGIPENGETIELVPLINNTGSGKAVNVDLKITSINNELTIQKETTTIPQILPSKKVTGNLVFSIPRNFKDNKINIDIQATDVRGVSTAKKAIEIRTETYQPIIAYQYKLIDNNHNGFLENGEEGELEIQPVNNGKMDAKNLSINVRADDLLFSI